ncbi:transposase [Ktedonosporobacter rubrisoli]|uniref:Transposase n=1 Tax=Ktedonosporobacter rubrisoli TaxID=2509675 RepID=A0A4P6JL08_KTERU|nr:helix-turn-helix domain-containing protein [Ktedonosporobacter rubrisoli]QBD75690.1 transposase [Ktedonosporobacter rubrisoli]
MPQAKRERRERTDNYHLLKQWCRTPEQRLYEGIKPVVLFGTLPTERAEETGLAARSLGRAADAFDTHGIISLFRPTKEQREDHHRSLPVAMRQLIVDLKAEYADFTDREIAAICAIQFNGRRPSHHTVKAVLTYGPPPQRTGRQFARYAEIVTPQERRQAVIRLHAQGWSISTIARDLDVSRPTIYDILKRWVEEGVLGLADKPHVNTSKPGVDLPTRNLIRKKQEENPLLGEFRMYAALKQLGISCSPRTCGRIMAENRRFYGIKPKPGEPHKPKPHPFKSLIRHERWCLDIRYLEKHRIPEIKGSFYVITIMDAFSRAIRSRDIFQSQDLSCVLIVLYAAIERFGAPKKLITDNGGVFRAKQLLVICEALNIEKEYIHKRQSWQNLVETHFNVMRRMSQVHFEQITSWQGAKLAHERFVTNYNVQPRLRAPQARRPSDAACGGAGRGDRETAHKRAVASHFLRNPTSAALRSARLRALSALEAVWGRNTGSPSCGHLGPWECTHRRIPRDTFGPVYGSLSTR